MRTATEFLEEIFRVKAAAKKADELCANCGDPRSDHERKWPAETCEPYCIGGKFGGSLYCGCREWKPA